MGFRTGIPIAFAVAVIVGCASERPPPTEPPPTLSSDGPRAVYGGIAPPASAEGAFPAPRQQIAAIARPVAGARRGVPVAMMLPLSGPQGPLGQAMLDAALLALDDVDDGTLELIPVDTRGTPDGAQRAMQQALGQGVELVLGPLLSSSVQAMAPWARQAGVNVISFSTDRRIAGDGVFLMGFLPRAEVERTVSYARQKGLRRFAALAPDNVYGKTVVQELKRAAGLYGGIVTSESFYNPDGRDFTEMVKSFADYDRRTKEMQRLRVQLKQRGDATDEEIKRLELRETAGELSFDALLLPDGGARLLSVAPLLPFFDVDASLVQFIGTGLWDDPMVSTEPALSGGWYAAPDPRTRAKFVKRFADIYGREPERIVTLAYDSVALASVLSRSPSSDRFGPAAITDPNGFAGIDGIFRFLPNGLVDRGLAVLEMRKGAPRVVDPAAKTFQRLTN